MKLLLHFILLFSCLYGHSQLNVNARLVKLNELASYQAPDTVSAVRTFGTLWYDTTTDQFRVMDGTGAKFTLESAATPDLQAVLDQGSVANISTAFSMATTAAGGFTLSAPSGNGILFADNFNITASTGPTIINSSGSTVTINGTSALIEGVTFTNTDVTGLTSITGPNDNVVTIAGNAASGFGNGGVDMVGQLAGNPVATVQVDGLSSAVDIDANVNIDITAGNTGTGDINLVSGATGNVVIDGLDYPVADGTNGQVLTTDGSGGLTFQDASAGTSGTYTPTETDLSNITTSTVQGLHQFYRVGDVVTVSGQYLIEATAAATSTNFRITIPVASNFDALNDCLGSVSAQNSSANDANSGSISTDTINDEIIIRFIPNNASPDAYIVGYVITYLVK